MGLEAGGSVRKQLDPQYPIPHKARERERTTCGGGADQWKRRKEDDAKGTAVKSVQTQKQAIPEEGSWPGPLGHQEGGAVNKLVEWLDGGRDRSYSLYFETQQEPCKA